ncbi:PepSY domain-containing protein [Phyllobacterium sp. 628]|uniref:PepSY domain-containing protein n=1 Tax=Phyllobacterium sp. 628 TaxID=2718938 RepID=UPI00166277E9|nr:PepSY domain-containing protein [Phyllobacterium sp. 628]QND53275.1 PepSY domain-containing protein [Phyllobacterium sp. 628]
MFKSLAIAGAAALTLMSVAPSFSQSLQIGPDGVRLVEPRVDRPMRRGMDISEREAVRVARSEGLRSVDNVDRTRSRFIVEGTDRRGNDMRVSVDRRTGEVISVD